MKSSSPSNPQKASPMMNLAIIIVLLLTALPIVLFALVQINPPSFGKPAATVQADTAKHSTAAERRAERGFNQSELLAETLARRINRRLDTRSLIRRRDTEHQARSSGKAHRANLHAAFAVRRPEFVRGRTALLVDDVMTTGATLSACAQTLRDGGAARVWCLTLARATLDG